MFKPGLRPEGGDVAFETRSINCLVLSSPDGVGREDNPF
jgi:hypothetical protein